MLLRSNFNIYGISRCKIRKLRPLLKKIIYWEFPGGLVVRIRHFHTVAAVQSHKLWDPINCLVWLKKKKKNLLTQAQPQLSGHVLLYPAAAAAAAAKSLQSCPTLCDPTGSSPPGSPVPGILQARTLEWVAISFSNAWKWKVKVKSLSRVRLLVTPWTVADQAPLSGDFPGKSTGVGCHCYILGHWN